MRKRNCLPLMFGAIEGLDKSSSGEGNTSGKDKQSNDGETQSPKEILDSDIKLEARKSHKTMGVKSEPETLVTTPISQEKILDPIQEAKTLEIKERLASNDTKQAEMLAELKATSIAYNPSKLLEVEAQPFAVVLTQTAMELLSTINLTQVSRDGALDNAPALG